MNVLPINLAVSLKGKRLLSKSIFENSKRAYALVLIVLVSMFMLTYRRSFIFPQQGWWQYYAWRMTEGDILYKDLFLFIPPYYAMMTAALYRVFHTSFIYYSVFVGLPIRMICLLLLYSVLCRKTKPAFACAAVFFGECFNQSYLMYALYDYNPIGAAISVILAYVMLQFYESYGQRAERKAFIVGVLCGILLMYKQTWGIGLSIVVVIMLGTLIVRQKQENWFLICLLFLFGLLDGLLPALIYFIKNDCFRDFLNCLFRAGGAKGGAQGLFTHLGEILSQWQYWVVAVLIYILGVACRKTGNGYAKKVLPDPNNAKRINKKIISVTLVPVLALLIAFNFSKSANIYYRKLMFALVFALAELFLLSILAFTEEKRWIHFSLIIITVLSIAAWSLLPEPLVRSLYENSSFWSIHYYIMNVLSYLMLMLWVADLIKYFMLSGEGFSCLVFLTIIACFFLISIVSAARMEASFMALVIPWAIIYMFEMPCSGKLVKDVTLVAAMLIFILMILSEKMIIPYDWQGWQSQPVQNNISIEIAGLEGYRTDPETAAVFEEIVDIIENNTSPEETVYSFANIPLFNALTKRKMPTYMPIHWFDVCPDEIAEEDNLRLLQNPPKIVIWHNLSDGEWKRLESVYRNGNKSGQRLIKDRFYENYVRNDYILMGEYDNHRDGTIQVWLRSK